MTIVIILRVVTEVTVVTVVKAVTEVTVVAVEIILRGETIVKVVIIGKIVTKFYISDSSNRVTIVSIVTVVQ